MTKLIFRSGLRTIGGTIVEVIDENDRIIFDFGTVYGEKEIMPEVEGIYDNTSKYNDLVLISHIHLDHNKAMNLIDNNIDIVMNEKSIDYLNTLYEIGFSDLLGDKRSYCSINDKETIKHGNFEITNLLVDHDVLGASAFLIKTSDLVLFYSGDIRLHGRKKEYTYEMIEYIKSLNVKVDVAIFEGVTISFIDDQEIIVPSNEVEEFGLEEEFPELIIDTINEKQILVNPYIMGIERIESIFSLARKLNKKVCVTPKFSYIINKYFTDYDFLILEADEFKLNKNIVEYSQIDESMIAFFDFSKKELYSKFNNPVALLQTGGEPLGEFDNRWTELEAWASQNNVSVYKVGASGHASPNNLMYIIDEINPTYLIPLHSFKPELVKSKRSIQILPEKDKEYEFVKNKLIQGRK